MRRQGEDKVPTDTIVLTFDSPKPPTSIRAAYLTLSVRPYVPNPMRCFKCQRFGHGKDRCRRSAELCARCGKGGHAEHQCKADPHCVNCHGEHSASSKECPKYLEELAILRYRAEHGGTFQQARKNVVVDKPRAIAQRSYASAVRPSSSSQGKRQNFFCPNQGRKNPEGLSGFHSPESSRVSPS